MKKPWTMRSLILLLFFLCALQLTACHRKDDLPDYIRNPVITNLPEQQRVLLAYIQKHSGIQVIKQGMKFTFVLPTDCFFKTDTNQLKYHSLKYLDALAQFIREYTAYFAHPHISVTGYTDKTWFSPARDKLSRHYARVIANYLFEDGIDVGRIDIKGEGAKHPIASNQYPMGTAFNRRVEVIVR